jgi:hypothetical protein
VPVPLSMQKPSLVQVNPLPHSVPPTVQSVSHFPPDAQWKPPGQLVAAPGAGSHVVWHAAGGT